MNPYSRFQPLLDDLAEAPFQPELWPRALAHVATMTGSRIGQLWGYHRDLSFNWMSRDGMEVAWREYVALGGGDPDINPRVRMAKRIPLLTSVTDDDIIIPPRLKARNRFYADFYERWDLPHICFSMLRVSSAGHVGASVLRSRAEGPIELAQRRVFDQITPHLASAVRTQAALEAQGATMAAGGFEALSIAAVMCDAAGRMTAASRAALELMDQEGSLVLREGRVEGPSDPKGLQEAVAAAGRWMAEPSGVSNRELLLQGRTGMVLADIAPLPRQPWALGLGAAVVIILKRQAEASGSPRRLQVAMRNAYGLTEAESHVAALLAQGSSRAAVAVHRGVSVETVRVQSRTIFDKLSVGRQTELMALAAQL